MRGLAPVLFLAVAGLAPLAAACDYPGGPPGAEPVTAEGEGVVWAYYSNATDRYGHGVLGDAWEAAALRTMIAGCSGDGVIESAVHAEDAAPETVARAMDCA